MAPVILFAVLAGLPVLNAVLLRVNAIVLFTSIAIGNFLLLYLSDDVILAVNAFTKAPNVTMIVQLTLLLLPVVLAFIFMRKTIGRGAFLLHVVPIIGCGLSLALLALPIFSGEVQAQVFGLEYGNILKNSQDLVLSITAIMVLLLMFHSNRGHDDKHKKKHR